MIFSMRHALLCWVAFVAVGCRFVKPAGSADMADLASDVHAGMKEDDVIRVLGEPDKKLDDPATGYETWSYHNDHGTGGVMVSFSMDEVVDVRSTSL